MSEYSFHASGYTTVGRAGGTPIVGIADGAFCNDPHMEQTFLAFSDRRSWQRAWRMVRMMVRHGIRVVPEKVDVDPTWDGTREHLQ